MNGGGGMRLSGSPPYYLHTAVSGSSSNFGTGIPSGFAVPPGFKNLNPNIRATNSASTYQFVDNPSPNFGHGVNTGVVASDGLSYVDTVKKKRGRPRKSGPGGANMSPMSSSAEALTAGDKENKNGGRPRGSGRKQRLAVSWQCVTFPQEYNHVCCEWMNSSAGSAFTPHVIRIGSGEDVSSKILYFTQQRPRALCILCANGSVSAVTLRQPTSSGSHVTYEVDF